MLFLVLVHIISSIATPLWFVFAIDLYSGYLKVISIHIYCNVYFINRVVFVVCFQIFFSPFFSFDVLRKKVNTNNIDYKNIILTC